jgi:uncharacterized membrane protein YbhN (UPF0104 family)
MHKKFRITRHSAFFLFNIAFVGLFAVALSKVDWMKLGHHLIGARPVYLVFILLSAGGALVAQALAWRYILSFQGIPFPLLRSVRAFLGGNYLGKVTPGHVGDFLRAAYVVDGSEADTGFALSGIMYEKVLKDLALVLTTLSLLLIYPVGYQLMTPMKASALILGMAAMLFMVATVYFHPRVRAWFISIFTGNGFLNRYRELLEVASDGIDRGRSAVDKRHLIIPFLVLLLSFYFYFWEGYLVNRVVGTGLPFITISRFVLVSQIAGRLVPFTLMGIGARELALLALFKNADVSLTLATGYIAVEVFVQNVAFPFIGLFLWTTKSPAILKEGKEALPLEPREEYSPE